MRKAITFLAVAAVLLLPARLLLGRWGPMGCAAVAADDKKAGELPYRWVSNPKVPKEVYLYQGNVQVGGYSFESGFYLPLVNGKWGKPCQAPIRPPLEGLDGKKEANLFGVLADQVSREERYECTHGECSREHVMAMLAEGLTDDSKQGRVTVIDGDRERRKKIAADWSSAPSLDKARSTWQFQAYDPASPVTREMLRPFRLEQSSDLGKGLPVVFAQAPANAAGVGPVLGQWNSYQGADALAEALRKVDPNFDPNKPLAPILPSVPSLSGEDWAIIGLGGLLVIVAFLRVRSP